MVALALGAPAAQAAPGAHDLLTDANVVLTGPGSTRYVENISSAGDLNGDGRGDLLVTASNVSNNGRSNSGSVHVVFGAEAPTSVDLENLGTRGYRIDGPEAGARITSAVALGDVNLDGRPDLAILSKSTDYNGRANSGSVWVVFGSASSANVDLATLGSRGYRIDGATTEKPPETIVPAGDVNGDGRADLAIGALHTDVLGRGSYDGAVWVIFGAGGTTRVDLASPGSRGFRINGGLSWRAGWSLSSAGDVNGDGRGDLLVGAKYYNVDPDGPDYKVYGAAFVVYGSTSTTTVDLPTIPASRGFIIRGAQNSNAGEKVASLGDVNGDGRNDLAVALGTNDATLSGRTYVVYGTPTPGPVDLADLGTQGFQIDGAPKSRVGQRGISAGDFNGDGLADIVLPSYTGDYNDRTGSGSVTVLYGSTTHGNVDLANPTSRSFRIDGPIAGNNVAVWTAALKDFNGDGRDDIALGGVTEPKVYIVYGSRVTQGDVTGTAGEPVDVSPTVTKTGAATFSVSPALPTGLTLDADSGRVHGTPQGATDQTFTLTMTDDHHETSDEFKVDVTAAARPETTLTDGPSGAVASATPTFTFSASGTTATTTECRIDGDAWAACTSPFTTPALADGPHTFEVRGVNADGADPTPEERSFTVDTTAPVLSIDAGPAGLTRDVSPRFEFSTPATDVAAFECRLDDGAWTECETLISQLVDLEDGAHVFEVRATDRLGHVGTASRSFTVDATAPVFTFDAGPSGPTRDASPRFAFSTPATDVATVECRLDGGAWTACDSLEQTFSHLADGPHELEVRATDHAGNERTAARAFTVDTVAPVVAIDGGPHGVTGDASPRFTFSSAAKDVASVECRLDDGAWVACDATSHTLSDVADGKHTFQVRVTDHAGNVGTAGRAFAVLRKPAATVAPEITGSPVVGRELQVSPGTWSGTPDSVSLQWLRCDGGGCVPIAGATGERYQLTAPDAGRTLVVQITATNAGGTTEVRTGPTGTVTEPAVTAPPEPTPPPTATPMPPLDEDARRKPPMLQVPRVALTRGKVDVLAKLTRGATGKVAASFRAKGKTARWTTPISKSGELKVSRKLTGGRTGVKSGIVELRYEGDANTRPASIRLRAGGKPSRLSKPKVRVSGQTLTISGKVKKQARGVVRLNLEYITTAGTVGSLPVNAKIAKGRWSVSAAVPADLAYPDVVVSAQFTGDLRAGLQGALTAVALAL